MNSNINTIVVVGGGSAGWMVASTLIKTFPEKNITLVASESMPTIGVGESTLPDINTWLNYLDINIKDFLSEVDGSYKLGIGFTNFYTKNSKTIFYPFGFVNTENSLYGLLDWQFRKGYEEFIEPQDYALTHYPVASLFEENKVLESSKKEFFPFIKERDTAYQIDASKFGWYLRNKYAIPRGVVHINNYVVKTNICKEGISSLILDNGQEIFGDLFVDCSGFKSILLGEALKGEFVSTKEFLPNNMAWAGPIQYTNKEKELETYTNCTAIENGWVWNTPLWSRIGSGYVYCNDYVDDDSALSEFKNYLDSDKMKVHDPYRSKNMDFRKIHIKNGYYKKAWIKNVCAIGLASGFLEPLESTGLWFTHQHSLYLMDTIKRGLVNQFDKDIYNAKVNKDYKYMFDFVAQHYAFSHRNDTEYWKDINNKTFSEDMAQNMPNGIAPDGFSGFLDSFAYKKSYSGGTGITAIANGFSYHLYQKHDIEMMKFFHKEDYIEKLKASFIHMDVRKKYWKEFSKNLPSHYEYLKKEYYEN